MNTFIQNIHPEELEAVFYEGPSKELKAVFYEGPFDSKDGYFVPCIGCDLDSPTAEECRDYCPMILRINEDDL